MEKGEIPFYVPKYLTKKSDLQNRNYNYQLNDLQRIFLLLDDPSSCELARYFSFLMIFVIVLSCVSYVLATDPTIKYQPTHCENPVCSNQTLCPNRQVCEPIPPNGFSIVEIMCIVVFTADYCIRVFLVGLVPPRLAGIQPTSWDENSLQEYQLTGLYLDDPTWNPLHTIVVYIFQIMNLIDLAAIVPFYLQYCTSNSSSISIVRVLRLARMFRVFKASKYNKGANLLATTMSRSFSALSLLFFFTVLGVVLFGSLIYFMESGTFTVTEDSPNGIYLRPNYLGSELEETPFQSILISCYWVIVTATTVGFGDLYPTTTGGRIVACVCMYCGLLVLALPITIVGSNFTTVYNEKVAQDWEEEKQKIQIETGGMNSNQSSLRGDSNGNDNNDNDNGDDAMNGDNTFDRVENHSEEAEKGDELNMLPSDHSEHKQLKTTPSQNIPRGESFIDRQSSYGSLSNEQFSPPQKKALRAPGSLSLPWELTFLRSHSKQHLLQEDNSSLPTEPSTITPQRRQLQQQQQLNDSTTNKRIELKGKYIIRKYITILRIVKPKSKRYCLKYYKFHPHKQQQQSTVTSTSTGAATAAVSSENVLNSLQQILSANNSNSNSNNSSNTLFQLRSNLLQISNSLNQLLSQLECLETASNNSTPSTTTTLTMSSPPPHLQHSQSSQYTTPSPNKTFSRNNFSNLRSFSVSNSITQQHSPLTKKHSSTQVNSFNVEKQVKNRSSEKKIPFRTSSSYRQLDDTI